MEKQEEIKEIMSKEELEEPISDTIYDDVLRTMCERHILFLIPLVNKYLGTQYTMDAAIELLNNEHHKAISGKMDIKVTDAFFKITENGETHIYHIECQSVADSSMIIRIVEYDFMIALDEMARTISEDKYQTKLTLPETMVIYLRHTENMPDEFQVDIEYQNQKIVYKVPIIKTKKISLETMRKEQLYFFLPFYLMRYETQIKEGTEKDIEQVLEQIEALKKTIIELTNSKKIQEYYGEQLIIYSRRILTKMVSSNKNESVKERLVESMSGQIIKTKLDEIFDAGKLQGKTEGISIGKEQGENIMAKLIQKLFDSNRVAEIQKMSEDEVYRKKLIKEFGLK